MNKYYLSKGIEQGGFFSPFLFTLYRNGATLLLSTMNAGSTLSYIEMTVLMYGDEIAHC